MRTKFKDAEEKRLFQEMKDLYAMTKAWSFKKMSKSSQKDLKKKLEEATDAYMNYEPINRG